MFAQAYPDVAALGYDYLVVYQGNKTYVGGTSCSSPTFAAIVSMLNDARISDRKAPLGFLNPFLYAIGYTALNDITEGNNPGCGTEGFNVRHIRIPSSRFIDVDTHGQATKGWDPGESKQAIILHPDVDNTRSYWFWDAQFREVESIGLEHAL
jgi:hypothetical protein